MCRLFPQKPFTKSERFPSVMTWGLSRHVNYFGEILMGLGIGLAAGYPAVWQVWIYPVYITALMFTREYDDRKICRAKYGELWDTYTKKVKYRIIPFIY